MDLKSFSEKSLRDWMFWYSCNMAHTKTWKGVLTQKFPLDVWIYQEMIYEIKPQVIVELGTSEGGGSRLLQDIMRIVGDVDGQVITVGLNVPRLPLPEPIRFIQGDDTDLDVVSLIRRLIGVRAPVMVIADSDHARGHVFQQLVEYSTMVTVGSYFIVEDTWCDVLHLAGCPREGPLLGVQDFMETDAGLHFEVDKSREKFIISCATGGFLRRIS